MCAAVRGLLASGGLISPPPPVLGCDGPGRARPRVEGIGGLQLRREEAPGLPKPVGGNHAAPRLCIDSRGRETKEGCSFLDGHSGVVHGPVLSRTSGPVPVSPSASPRLYAGIPRSAGSPRRYWAVRGWRCCFTRFRNAQIRELEPLWRNPGRAQAAAARERAQGTQIRTERAASATRAEIADAGSNESPQRAWPYLGASLVAWATNRRTASVVPALELQRRWLRESA